MGENISPVMKFTGDIGVGVMEKMLVNRPLQGRGAADMNMINAYYTHAWVCRNPSLYTASMPWTRRSQAGVPTLTVSTLSDYRRSHLVRFMTSWHSLTPRNSYRVWMEAKVCWTGGGLWATSCLGDLMLESERTDSSQLQEMGCGNIRVCSVLQQRKDWIIEGVKDWPDLVTETAPTRGI